MRICFRIAGKRICITIPLLVVGPIKPPPPNNYPPFELAATVLEMVRVVGTSELSKQLSDVVTRYIGTVQKQLPDGVEIVIQQTAEKTG
jgi:hypothetical protein